MSFAADLTRATADLAALCRRCFGPSGEETLLFRPPDAPVVTGEGHAVLAAWKRGVEAHDPLATFVLAAADGVHRQLGDASSEFVLLVDAAVRYAHERMRRQQDIRSGADRARLSRAFGELKWELQREMQTPHGSLCGLQLIVPVEVDSETMQTSKQRALQFVVELVLEWVFTAPLRTGSFGCDDVTPDKILFRRVQQFLKCAPDAIIHMAAPSLYDSYVVPFNDFILKKSLVTSQPPGLLDRCQGSVKFVCFTCPLSLSAGSNNVELATNTYDELFTAHDAARLFVSKFVRRLHDCHQVQVIVSTEALDESFVAVCTRQDIACVQLAEPEDVEALCIIGAIFPLASAFDDIENEKHIGICTTGISRVRFQQQACLRFRGVAERRNQRKDTLQSENQRQTIAVPQLLIYAPTKGVYKQYYAAIVKSLRVLISWWEPLASTSVDPNGTLKSNYPALVYSCRGGGATELAVARWLKVESNELSEGILACDGVVKLLARGIIADALIDVVSNLRSNLNHTCSSASDEEPTSSQHAGNQRQVLLEAFSNLKLQEPQKIQGYTLDYSRVVLTLAGPILIPQLIIGDPEVYGLIHPWRRIDTLLFLVLQTLEQLFRTDRVFTKTISAGKSTSTSN
ncbi:unnamed protein product [Phytophthora fragariaefolia]|uniref:Unnamed protein product n=1 Tax=Phytophthora fragariaefolia TaxID=1490495 RepID=A0A9W7CXX1_9STRA|nr:unnamed protein product [Phytophthora fragariaefolia]